MQPTSICIHTWGMGKFLMNILETANVLSRFGVIFTLIFSDMYRTVRRVISFRETNTENKIYRISRSNAVDTLL
jgi:hypothetical protein